MAFLLIALALVVGFVQLSNGQAGSQYGPFVIVRPDPNDPVFSTLDGSIGEFSLPEAMAPSTTGELDRSGLLLTDLSTPAEQEEARREQLLRAEQERRRAEQERTTQERLRTEQERARAEQEKQRTERERLRSQQPPTDKRRIELEFAGEMVEQQTVQPRPTKPTTPQRSASTTQRPEGLRTEEPEQADGEMAEQQTVQPRPTKLTTPRRSASTTQRPEGLRTVEPYPANREQQRPEEVRPDQQQLRAQQERQRIQHERRLRLEQERQQALAERQRQRLEEERSRSNEREQQQQRPEEVEPEQLDQEKIRAQQQRQRIEQERQQAAEQQRARTEKPQQTTGQQPKQFPSQQHEQMFTSYVTIGILTLPFDNVTEDFTLFYDSKADRSRVDFGGHGRVRTIQLGDKNKYYTIEFPSRESLSGRPVCVEMLGRHEKSVKAQRGVPDISKFTRVGYEQFLGDRVYRWKKEIDDAKHSTKHVYSLLTEANTLKPLRLEVVSNSMKTGQVVDRYYIDYQYFFPTKPSNDLFTVPADIECRSSFGLSFEGNKDAEKIREETRGRMEEELERLNMNPLSCLIEPSERLHLDQELDKVFEGFKRGYGKKYESEQENDKRRTAFFHNYRYVNLMNRASLSYRLRINHLADLTNEELGKMLGFRRTQIPRSTHRAMFDPTKHNLRGLDGHSPASLDWRLFGAVSTVADQKQCGGDWAIAVADVVQSALYLKTNRRWKLSAQELIDCSDDEGNEDCRRGEDFRAYDYVLKHGLSSEWGYGPFVGPNSECRRDAPASAKIDHWVLVPSNNEYELKRAIAMNGPVAVAVDAAHKSFFFYASGVYWEPKCHSRPDAVNHAAVVVGYGNLNGRDYLIVKNSWSEDWGSDGYMLIDYSHNHCSILSWPTFVSF